jgi:hypothetical protein
LKEILTNFHKRQAVFESVVSDRSRRKAVFDQQIWMKAEMIDSVVI